MEVNIYFNPMGSTMISCKQNGRLVAAVVSTVNRVTSNHVTLSGSKF